MNKPIELQTLPHWIGGKPVASQSGRVGDVTNPATGKVIRRVPMASSADVDAAVSAARAALPAWRDTSPQRRARVLQQFLALLRANATDIARIVSEEHGKTLPDAAGSLERGIEVVEFACGIPHLLKGEHSENVATGVDYVYPAAAARGVRRHHAVQFPGDGAAVDVSGGDCLRQHLHPQAVGEGSVGVDALAELFARGWSSCWRIERRARRQGSGRRDSRTIRESPPCRSSARPRSPTTSTKPARATASASRRSGGAKNHAVVLPDADLEFCRQRADRCGLRFRRRTLHGDLGGGRGGRGRRIHSWSDSRRRPRRSRSGPVTWTAWRWGRS